MALTKVSTGVVDLSDDTGALSISKGTTAQRPSTSVNGMLRANTTTNKMEVYTSTGWRVLKEGGNVIIPLTVDYLVIAGGGGGGSWTSTSNVGTGGGGGAGGFRTSWTGQGSGGGCAVEATPTLASNTQYNVTVGAGGAGQPFNTSTQNNGVNSEFNGIVSNGGGAGGSYVGVNANSGGSGGGAGYLGSGGQVVAACQGNIGGSYGTHGSPYRHGGGGGAAGSGQNGGYNGTGAGGVGLRNSITLASGTGPYYAGGGGGGVSYVTSVSPGGSAVGGSGGNQNLNATNPTVNTGSGGGGAGKGTQSTVTTPSAGADGVVILRYPTDYSIAVTGSLFRTNATVGSDTVTTFISGTGTITFS